MSNFNETDNFLNPNKGKEMQVKGAKVYIPVCLTFDTEIEYLTFWDAIELVLQDRGILLATQRELFIEISNNFACLK
jgi:hypothetical protein